jgi:hypothetical protein
LGALELEEERRARIRLGEVENDAKRDEIDGCG